MKNTNFSLKVFFIILFLSSIILSFFSDDFSFLPKEFNFDSILYLLIPALVLNTDCSPWINPGGSKGGWDVTDRTGDISKKVEMSFFYFRSIPKSP